MRTGSKVSHFLHGKGTYIGKDSPDSNLCIVRFDSGFYAEIPENELSFDISWTEILAVTLVWAIAGTLIMLAYILICT